MEREIRVVSLYYCFFFVYVSVFFLSNGRKRGHFFMTKLNKKCSTYHGICPEVMTEP